MVLKSAFAALLCSGLLALAGPAMADDYRPGESRQLLSPKSACSVMRCLKLDLPKAVLSPKRLGPETQFAPVAIEARSDRADAYASVWPRPPARKAQVAKPQIAKPQVAQRRGNPLDAQARDTRIQTWPCKSGAICGWQR